MARTKKQLPVGNLKPLRPLDPRGLQVDEEGTIFNSSGNRRGLANERTPAVEIAHKHNWDLLVIKGAMANLRHMLYNLTPPNPAHVDPDLVRAKVEFNKTLQSSLDSLEEHLVREVEASREQAKKNLKI